ncbi:MAG: PHP-associated domain-containing protein [Bacteroidales bacterium]
MKDFSFIRSSDAHCPDQIGSSTTVFEMKEVSFEEIRRALTEGRGVIEDGRRKTEDGS